MRKQIEEFVNRLLPKDWDSWSLEQRRMFWQDKDMVGECERTKVCALEIWQELYCRDADEMSLIEARNINNYLKRIPYYKAHSSVYCGPIYGRQRGFVIDAIAIQISKMANKKFRYTNRSQ